MVQPKKDRGPGRGGGHRADRNQHNEDRHSIYLGHGECLLRRLCTKVFLPLQSLLIFISVFAGGR